MKILTVSDEPCDALWEHYLPGRLKEYDLIISCGDLKSSYLEFLVTMAKCPVLYVHGNHDTAYRRNPPWGCDCIDDAIVSYNGLKILGLGGCLWYHPGEYQYSELQMRRRIRKLRRTLKKMGGVDVVVTHAPPKGLGDAEDRAHRGFAALRELIEEYHPKYLFHGHVHITYGHNIPRELEHQGTHIINCTERYVVDVPDPEYPAEEKGQVLYRTRFKYPYPDMEDF